MVWLALVGLVVVAFGFVVFFGAPYVPSLKRDVRRVFDGLYPLGNKDVLVDAGSGDGRVLRLAAERGARAVGYEIHPVFVMIARLVSRNDPRITVRWADFWRSELPPETTVVYIFGVGRDVGRLSRKLQAEADRLSRPLALICYGNPLKDRAADKTQGAAFLYHFHPLQGKEA